jgi:hypothetical protein
MIPLRTQIKFFLENPQGVNLSTFTGVFQRWIQQNVLEELLIDVADYRHVFEGPGIMLIGYGSDYAIENRNNRLGLLYTRKRQLEPDLQTQLRVSFQFALAACRLLESEASFKPQLKFRADEIEVRFLDRLQLPNRPDSFDLVKDDLEAVLKDLYGSQAVHFASVSQDPRYVFTILAHSEGARGIADSFGAGVF